MVSVSHPVSARTLVGAWALLLLPPLSWAAALGVQFSLTDETCVTGSRSGLWVAALTSLLVSAIPGFIAVRWRSSVSAGEAAGDWLRFLLAAAAMGAAIFTLVNLLSAVPIVWLDSCRT
jgi:hypothetical protein